MESEQKFVPWTKHVDENDNLYDEIIKGNEPTPYTKVEMLEYLAICDGLVDGCVDAIDFTAIDCGFSWYNMPKFNHQLVNLRHIMAHQGQLSEILNENGIDTKWFGGSYPKS